MGDDFEQPNQRGSMFVGMTPGVLTIKNYSQSERYATREFTREACLQLVPDRLEGSRVAIHLK